MPFAYNEWEDVSVIVPALNASGTLSRAIHSITRQTTKPLEIIIIDGGSTDHTYELAEKLANLEGGIVPIKVFKHKSHNVGEARNHGIQQANGTLLAFLDADDEWHPNKLERSLEEMRKHQATLIAHDVIEQYPAGRKFYVEYSKRFEQEKNNSHTQLYLHDYINTSTVVVRADAVRTAGGFNTSFKQGVDYDLWLAILANPKNSFHVFKGALVSYHISNTSISSKTWQRLSGYEFYTALHSKHSARKTLNLGITLALARILIICMEISQRTLRRGEIHKLAAVLVRMPYSVLKVLLLAPLLNSNNRAKNIK